MEIRRMSEADVFDVAAIEAKVFSQPWSEQGFRDALAMNHVIFLVAEEAMEDEAVRIHRKTGGAELWKIVE